MDKNILYRSIPKVDELLAREDIRTMIAHYGRESVMEAIHRETDSIRRLISESSDECMAEKEVDRLPERIGAAVEKMYSPNMKPVINGTGTILHTNLGRAPISRKHAERILEAAVGYTNLEYNLEAGRRGERYAHFEALLCRITGAEAAMAVNNNAAAVMLILSTMARGGEVVVSRGELVEIGGKFRIPDVMAQSGARLVEVGTTNKTHPDDYEAAVNENTKALLKVHTSNYRIVGFTETVDLDVLVPLAREKKIPLIEDLGSGVLVDLSRYGLTPEPTVQESVKKGADIVCFSGDKLLGGPQAGVIVGKKKYIDMMKKNQLTRALRIDKFTATALEAVLQEYLSQTRAVENIPVLKMITKPLEDIEKRAYELVEKLVQADVPADFEIIGCDSQIGGGSLPLERIPSMAVTINPHKISTTLLEERMRHLPVPIIPRVVNDRVLLDMRTVPEDKCPVIWEQLKSLNVLEEEMAYGKGILS